MCQAAIRTCWELLRVGIVVRYVRYIVCNDLLRLNPHWVHSINPWHCYAMLFLLTQRILILTSLV